MIPTPYIKSIPLFHEEATCEPINTRADGRQWGHATREERERVFPENARTVRFIVFVDFENAKLPITPPP